MGMKPTTDKAVPLIAVVEGYGVESAVAKAGGLSFEVRDKDSAKLALSHADGIILTGGGDVDPARYGAERHNAVYGVDHARDKLEFWLVRKAKERGIPIMGICRGSQVLNVAHGGTIDQHIYDREQVTEHWGTELWVKLARSSRLARSLNTATMRSSHYHHQAVKGLGNGLRAIAWAHDGTIEAIESTPSNKHYVLGVQFHPEMDYRQDDDAMAVFTHFVWSIAARFSAKRKAEASERLSLVEYAMPVPTYDYRGAYGYSETVRSYNYENDEWEYQEWWELNSHAPTKTADPFDDEYDMGGLCDFPPCATPGDCAKWDDCAAAVIAARTALTTEHVHYQSADAKAIAENKRGHNGGGAA